MNLANAIATFPLVTLPWWIWALVIGAMLAVLGVSILISARSDSAENPPQPPEPAAPEPEAEPEAQVAPRTAEIDAQAMEVRLPDEPANTPPRVVETPAPGLIPAGDGAPLGRGQDDLKLVQGISPGAATVLRQAGIQTFTQLAAAGVDDLEKILRAAGMRTLDPRSWPEQAGLAASGDWQALTQLKEQLKTKK